MLVFRSDLTVVEEIFEIAHNLTLRSALQQVRKRIAFRLLVEALG
jgi:hypothetical protein